MLYITLDNFRCSDIRVQKKKLIFESSFQKSN